MRDLELLFEAAFPLIAVETFEEPRLTAVVEGLALRHGWPLYTWKVTNGLQRRFPAAAAIPQTMRPVDLLKHLADAPGEGIYLLLDAHSYLADPALARLLKDAVQWPGRRTIVLVGHALALPADLKKLAAPFELAMPDETELKDILKQEVQRLRREKPDNELTGEAQAVDLLLQQLRGLGAEDARRIVRQVLVDDGTLTLADLEQVYRAKRELIGREGVLSFEFPDATLADLAGLDNLKRWLVARRDAFRSAASELDPPKGIMLLGVQGCGKSVAAKAVAVAWEVPLLRLDFGLLYNKYLGETERNLRESLKVADAMSPCVLWVDEIEKGIATGDGDGGESRRVLGTLLTWMAERKSRVFLVATSNDITQLPPELVRKGRLDEIFFVDLPPPQQRLEILGIHLRRRGVSSLASLDALAEATEGFSGAELEQVVVAGLYEAKAQDAALTAAHLDNEVRRTKPLSVVMAEKIARLRAWAADRTVPAG